MVRADTILRVFRRGMPSCVSSALTLAVIKVLVTVNKSHGTLFDSL